MHGVESKESRILIFLQPPLLERIHARNKSTCSTTTTTTPTAARVQPHSAASPDRLDEPGTGHAVEPVGENLKINIDSARDKMKKLDTDL